MPLPSPDPNVKRNASPQLENEMAIHYSVKINNMEYEPCEGAPEGKACTKGPWGIYKVYVTLSDGTDAVFECEAVLNATGRVPNVCNLGLEAVGVEFDNRQGVHIDECFMTTNPNIYSCGDCASPFKFTHAADWQARTAIRNMFLGTKDKHDQILTPWCTYTEPEVSGWGVYCCDF